MAQTGRAWLAAFAACTVLLSVARSGAEASDRPAGLCRAQWLFVSDNPEAVSTTRGLFYAAAGDARCIRLLYHHENAHPGSPLAIQVWAYDDDSVPAEIEVTSGVGGPAADPMVVGHRAAVRFWQAVLAGDKASLTIPPHQWKPLSIAVLSPHDVVSGLAQIAIKTGRLGIAVLANLPGVPEISPSSFLQRQGTHPFGVFASPLIDQRLEAPLDQPRGLLLAGTGFLRDPGAGRMLKGNYGVVYHLVVDCLNTSNRPMLLTLALMPLHGPAAGTLLVNGTLISVPPAARGSHREVARFWVPPGRWPVEIWAFPEGASAYPVELAFLPAPAQSTRSAGLR